MDTKRIRFCSAAALAIGVARAAGGDLLLVDFEAKDYAGWTAAGEAFGTGPARGTLPGQMEVTGFEGKGLVNSFRNGDAATGTLTSAEFTVERPYLRFLIGGGGYAGKTCMNLLVGGRVVRTATGPNTVPGGSEALTPASWDVREFAGRKARIEIVDAAMGGWGHINVDHIVQTDRRPPALLTDAAREIRAAARYLHFPVKTEAPKRKITVFVDGQQERFFDIELADGDPDWWAFLDIDAWKGRMLKVQVDRLSEDSKALASLAQADTIRGAEDLYREPLRPQLHFSPRRGWNNDPNGLVFFKGEYHLFYQHNPYGWNWGNMHWGHATSHDLVHWHEHGDVLAPDAMGPMYSGSGVVDRKNTSGLGRDGQPPLVLAYTAAGNPTVQCLAHSADGRSFTKFEGNPVVKQITGGNRDPKIVWHEPTGKWVMTLYVGLPDKAGRVDKKGRPVGEHTIHFLTSPDLRTWTVTDIIGGFFECPDFFELPVSGDAGKTAWVLTAANSDYMLGSFDGAEFKPETEMLKGHRGKGFYAAQTFSDIPASDGRRIQIGWLQAPSPGMPFNQAMSLPLELKLRVTAEGPRLAWMPVRELESLRVNAHRAGAFALKEGDANPLAPASAELVELRAEFEPGDATRVTFNLRGLAVVYETSKGELVVNGHRAPAPLVDGKLRLAVYVDRTASEVFAGDGLTYVPMPFIPRAEDRSLSVAVKGGHAHFAQIEVHELRSIWR